MHLRNSSRWAEPGLQPYLFALAGCAIAFLVRHALHPVLADQLTTFFFVANSVVIAFRFGVRPATLALAVGIPVARFSFAPPYFAFDGINGADVMIAIGVFGLTALSVVLIERLHRAHYQAELHARVSDSRYRMLVESDEDRRSALAGAQPDWPLAVVGAAPAAGNTAPAPLSGPARHAVLMLHGLCGTPVEMGSIGRMLERFGYTVADVEIAGYSASAVTPGVSPDWESWVEAVDAEVVRLRATHDTVSLCGLSMGATLGLAAAIRRSEVVAVVALSPILRYDGWAISWWSPLLSLPYYLGLRNWAYREREPFGLKNLDMRRRVKRAIERGDPSEVGAAAIPARQLHAARHMMGHVERHLPQVTSRVAVLHAVDDESASPRNAETILRRVSSEVRKAVWLGDSYHIITVDNEREVVTNAVVRFLQTSVGAHVEDQRHRLTGARSALRDRRQDRTRRATA